MRRVMTGLEQAYLFLLLLRHDSQFADEISGGNVSTLRVFCDQLRLGQGIARMLVEI